MASQVEKKWASVPHSSFWMRCFIPSLHSFSENLRLVRLLILAPRIIKTTLLRCDPAPLLFLCKHWSQCYIAVVWRVHQLPARAKHPLPTDDACFREKRCASQRQRKLDFILSHQLIISFQLEQRAPMSEKLSRLYSDSVLTEPFTIKSALRGASQKSSPWVGACIAFLVLFSIVGMLICWWLRCNKKSAGRHPRHGSITKVALTGNIMNGGGIPGETSKLLSTSNEYGRQIMNPYEPLNGNHHMESSMDLYPLPTSHSRTNGYAPIQVPLPSLPNNGNTITTIHPAVPIAELASHIERLRMNNNAGFQSEFESIETGQHFTWEHSSAEMNKHKNRYANVAAYDHTRVVLSNMDAIPGMDYINANYVNGYDKERSYIATQGPLPETFADFWRMVWEEQSLMIVMLTNLEERSRVKCDQYWPSRGTAVYGDVEVTLLESAHLAHYTMRTMRLKMIGEPEIREIKHLQYTAWPDHGVPDHPTPFLIFLKRVKTLNPPDAGPIISHCSAGIGRTGAFIVIDCMLERLRYQNTVDIYGCVTQLRAQRSYMVQTEEQYIFIHDAVLDAVNSGSTEVPASRLHQHVQALKQPSNDQISGIDMEFRVSLLSFLPLFTFVFQHLTTLKWTNNRCIVANLPVNRPKNRMLSAVPFDSNRVILHMIQGIEGSDYINASWIDGYKWVFHTFVFTNHICHSGNAEHTLLCKHHWTRRRLTSGGQYGNTTAQWS